MDSSIVSTQELFAHHAFLIEGERVSARRVLETALNADTAVFYTHGNPDYAVWDTDTFTIEHARELKVRATEKPVVTAEKVYCLTCSAFTNEAQNALLKLLEDPPGYAHFVLVVPVAESLLPTLRSRCAYLGRIAEKTTSPDSGAENNAQSFLAADPPQRIEAVKTIIQDKDKVRAGSFLNELEHELHVSSWHTDRAIAYALADIELCRRYLMDRAPSVKMILEYLAVTLPKI